MRGSVSDQLKKSQTTEAVNSTGANYMIEPGPTPAVRVVEEPSILAKTLQAHIDLGVIILDRITKEPGRFCKMTKGPFKGRLYFINDEGCACRVKPSMMLNRRLVSDPEEVPHG